MPDAAAKTRRRSAAIVGAVALVLTLMGLLLFLAGDETGPARGGAPPAGPDEAEPPLQCPPGPSGESPRRHVAAPDETPEPSGEEPDPSDAPDVVLRLRTTAGVPVAGFAAKVLTNVPGRVQRPVAEGQTDDDGELPLGRVTAGPYCVEIGLPTSDEDCGLWAGTGSSHFAPFDVTGETGADGVERIERAIPRFVRLRLRVAFADGEPIECASITGVVWPREAGPLRDDETSAAVRTDLDGLAEMTLPRSGVLHLLANVRPGAGSIFDEVDLETVPDGHTVEFVWGQPKGVPFQGRLRWPSASGLGGAPGAPAALAGVIPPVPFVELLRPTDGSSTASATFEPMTGRFEVFGLQPGDHLIRAVHPGVRPTPVHVPPAGIVDYEYVPDIVRALVSPTGRVEGWDARRAEDPGLGSWWEISLTHAEWPSVRRMTNVVVPEGADVVDFAFADLMPGTYRMTIAPPLGAGDSILEASLTLAELPARPSLTVDLRDSSVRRAPPREDD